MTDHPPPVPAWLDRFRAAAPHLTVPSVLEPPDGEARAAAVLILFGEGPEGPDILLTERAATLAAHAGQPAFPGGRIDPEDDGPVGAALREAWEEAGVRPAGVDVMATLPELYLPHSRHLVTPVAAWWREPSDIAPGHPGEVAMVARVPIAELVDPANRLTVRHPSGLRFGPAFRVRGMLVWGFTAGLLTQVLDAGGWNRPWNADHVEDLPSEVLDLAARD
ncbi:CoA pyrophosphatase [Actinomadura viridis]|uniref:8-oxo-dGTP pyrophosphatase MutT (NUDIX family) n=1 Tax=Actinomadura viridis TaxID=58110 RepID=A0A931GMX6_9ACTN|nr:CoA pyrophosphatase [Actinomadura viridis]MBG6092420.1 8-oxo-dGTP pyrophosphatase MutT (NUDIX family) [Actinomadura viridis]